MWFRNLVLYKLPKWSLDAAGLERALARQAFRSCSALEMESRGWTSPRGENEGPLVHTLGEHFLIALGAEQRLLPASIINQYARDRAVELEAKQGFKPGKKQLRDIKLRVADELMPRAFVRRRSTFAWIDAKRGIMAVDASALGKADELLEVLHKCVDGLAVTFLETLSPPASAMTRWLASHDAPSGFTIDRDCELLLPGADKSAVRYVRHTLETGEVRNHIAGGKQVTRLALTWAGRVSFVLCDNLQVKRVTFVDMKEESQQDAANAEEQFDADFALMSGELSRFLADLLDALGGEAVGSSMRDRDVIPLAAD
jgi:recombination associated protein RdgC